MRTALWDFQRPLFLLKGETEGGYTTVPGSLYPLFPSSISLSKRMPEGCDWIGRATPSEFTPGATVPGPRVPAGGVRAVVE